MTQDQMVEIQCARCGAPKRVSPAAIPAHYICSECRAAWKNPTPSA
jgi:DNA-directed RNA polymerase subunit RPC12/RpoP